MILKSGFFCSKDPVDCFSLAEPIVRAWSLMLTPFLATSMWHFSKNLIAKMISALQLVLQTDKYKTEVQQEH